MSEKKRTVWLIGQGMGSQKTRTREADEIIKNCDCIIGAKRLIREYENKGIPCTAEYIPERIRAYITGHPEMMKIAVLLSGDTGFYSGAANLEEAVKGDQTGISAEIIRLPGISSVAYLAAQLHTAWEDAALVSIHGRKQNFIHAVNTNYKTFLLLGGSGAEDTVDKLKYYGMGDLVVHIGKNLSYPDEEIITKQVKELTAHDMEGLCAAMIENPEPDLRTGRHICDEEFLRGNVPMTKEEVRALCMAKLQLRKNSVLYDVGAGTGSVSVEAALQSGKIRVYAVEKNTEAVELIRENVRKFRTDGVQVVEGTAPEALQELEPPTHVFIGGSSGNIKEILTCVKEKNPRVKIVLTCISLNTLASVMEAEKEGLLNHPEIVQISASRARRLGEHFMMTGQNPIYIITEGEA